MQLPDPCMLQPIMEAVGVTSVAPRVTVPLALVKVASHARLPAFVTPKPDAFMTPMSKLVAVVAPAPPPELEQDAPVEVRHVRLPVLESQYRRINPVEGFPGFGTH